MCLERHRQRAADRAQVAGERKLSGELVSGQWPRGKLAGRHEDAQRDRQIEAPGFFRQVGRRQVDRDFPARKFELGVLQCGPHALPAFLDFGIRQTDQVEGGQTRREMDLDRDRRRIETGKGPAVEDGKRHSSVLAVHDRGAQAYLSFVRTRPTSRPSSSVTRASSASSFSRVRARTRV